MGLQADLGGLLFDRFQLVQFAFAASGADLAGVCPGLGGADVGIPERPGATLARACGVHAALSRFGVEEDAIVVLQLLETFADADLSHVFSLKLGHLEPDLGSEGRDFVFTYPHVAGRAGAAVAAAGALEAQAIFVPGLIAHNDR